MRSRVKRAPGDAHDPRNSVVGLEHGDQAEPKRPGRAGHGNRQIILTARHSRLPLSGLVDICGNGITTADTADPGE
jgi:hypothetical protein